MAVVDEVALGVEAGLLGDDFHAVLVGAHGAVGAEAVEDGFGGAVGGQAEGEVGGQMGVADVIDDAEREAVAGGWFREFVEHRLGEGGGEVLGGEAVAAADDDGERPGVCSGRGHGGAGQHGDDFLEQRLTVGTGFLGLLDHRDAPRGGRQGGEEGFGGEGAEQADLEHADALAHCREGGGGGHGGFGAGAHQDDDALGVGRAGVVEQMILAAGEGGQAVHLLLHDAGHGGVERVRGFAGLKEGVRVVGGAAYDGVFRA